MPSIDSVPAKPRPHSSGTSDDSRMPATEVACQIDPHRGRAAGGIARLPDLVAVARHAFWKTSRLRSASR